MRPNLCWIRGYHGGENKGHVPLVRSNPAVSEEHIASIFMFEEWAKNKTSRSRLSLTYTALKPRKQYSSPLNPVLSRVTCASEDGSEASSATNGGQFLGPLSRYGFGWLVKGLAVRLAMRWVPLLVFMRTYWTGKSKEAQARIMPRRRRKIMSVTKQEILQPLSPSLLMLEGSKCHSVTSLPFIGTAEQAACRFRD
jgi:hypothetical protein